jgi:hypothetical protein
MTDLKQAKPIILVLAAFCFLLATLGVAHPRINFGWLGLFLLTLYWFF